MALGTAAVSAVGAELSVKTQLAALAGVFAFACTLLRHVHLHGGATGSIDSSDSLRGHRVECWR